jgi:regulator of replication initiation timing
VCAQADAARKGHKSVCARGAAAYKVTPQRKQSNRKSQQRYREKCKKEFEELEHRVAVLTTALENMRAVQGQASRLQEENERLRAAVGDQQEAAAALKTEAAGDESDEGEESPKTQGGPAYDDIARLLDVKREMRELLQAASISDAKVECAPTRLVLPAVVKPAVVLRSVLTGCAEPIAMYTICATRLVLATHYSSMLCRTNVIQDASVKDELERLLSIAFKGCTEQTLMATCPKENLLRHRAAAGAVLPCEQFCVRWTRILLDCNLDVKQQVRRHLQSSDCTPLRLPCVQ